MSADLDFFYKMIVNFKLRGKSTKKGEILGEFGKGGFSSKINYIEHLKDDVVMATPFITQNIKIM